MKLTEALDAHTKVLQTLKGNRNKFQEAAVEWTAQKLATSLKVPLSTLRRKITFWQS